MTDILHIDMDAFFASAEIAERPELIDKPVVVTGHIGNRSVVSAANYVARKYGIFSAMPLKTARNKCKNLIILTADFKKYHTLSHQIYKIIEKYTPDIEQTSIDEFYLDVSQSHLLFGSSEDIARQIKKQIKQAFHLTCSIGIAANKLLAKIGSDLHKPDGLTIINPGSFNQIIDPLSIEKIPGIGPKTAQVLHDHNIFLIRELRQFDLDRLKKLFGINALYLYNAARGIGYSQLTSQAEIKSVSHEMTFEYDTQDMDIIRKILLQLSDMVAVRLRKYNILGKTIKVKVKYFDFKSISRQISLNNYMNSSEEIFQNSWQLMQDLNIKPIRLLGIGVSTLLDSNKQEQLLIFNNNKKKDIRFDKNIDIINKKFGKDVIKRASLI